MEDKTSTLASIDTNLFNTEVEKCSERTLDIVPVGIEAKKLQTPDADEINIKMFRCAKCKLIPIGEVH